MLAKSLKEGGRSATAGGLRQRLRSTFVVVELAIALILLVGAGLLIKTFWKLRSVEPGFNPDHLLTMRVELPEASYKEKEKQTHFRFRRSPVSTHYRECRPRWLANCRSVEIPWITIF